jgi:hypothetical protein
VSSLEELEAKESGIRRVKRRRLKKWDSEFIVWWWFWLLKICCFWLCIDISNFAWKTQPCL